MRMDHHRERTAVDIVVVVGGRGRGGGYRGYGGGYRRRRRNEGEDGEYDEGNEEQQEPQQDLQDHQLPAEGQKNGGAPPADPPIENANGSEKNNA